MLGAMTNDPPDILALRTAAGLERTAAAAMIGVDQSTLWRWETGKARPNRHVLAALLAVYEEATRCRALADGGGAS